MTKAAPKVKSKAKPGGSAAAHVISADDARRMLLGAQALLDDPHRDVTPADVLKLIRRMGFVQIDSINVVDRAHHLTLFSRMHGFRPAMLSELLEKRRSLFEHWTHDASIIPSEFFAQWRQRFERHRRRIERSAWWRERMGSDAEALLKATLDHVRERGPLMSREFEPVTSRAQLPENGAWWGWKPQKAALEHLWRTGALAVARRVSFQKVYDLTERVLRASHLAETISPDEHIDWACRSALERLGAATAGEVAAFWHAIEPSTARQWCESAAKRGEIERAIVHSDDGLPPRKGYVLPGWRRRLAALPDATPGVRLLSPFDPVIRDRKRCLRLFGFDYRFEAFAPPPQRRFGYYVMPIMRGEQIIGRLDPKFHRDRGELEVRGLWWEPGVKINGALRRDLNEALERLAAFIGARNVTLPRT